MSLYTNSGPVFQLRAGKCIQLLYHLCTNFTKFSSFEQQSKQSTLPPHPNYGYDYNTYLISWRILCSKLVDMDF